MKKKSIQHSKIVVIHGKDIPPATPRDIARLKRTAKRPIDTSDIPELTEEDWRRAIGPRQRLPRRTVPLVLDKDVAKAVKKAGPNRVNFILRRYLIIESLRQARKAG